MTDGTGRAQDRGRNAAIVALLLAPLTVVLDAAVASAGGPTLLRAVALAAAAVMAFGGNFLLLKWVAAGAILLRLIELAAAFAAYGWAGFALAFVISLFDLLLLGWIFGCARDADRAPPRERNASPDFVDEPRGGAPPLTASAVEAGQVPPGNAQLDADAGAAAREMGRFAAYLVLFFTIIGLLIGLASTGLTPRVVGGLLLIAGAVLALRGFFAPLMWLSGFGALVLTVVALMAMQSYEGLLLAFILAPFIGFKVWVFITAKRAYGAAAGRERDAMAGPSDTSKPS